MQPVGRVEDGKCTYCTPKLEAYGVTDQVGFIPAGPLAPLTGFTCPQCHGTGQQPWFLMPEYEGDE